MSSKFSWKLKGKENARLRFFSAALFPIGGDLYESGPRHFASEKSFAGSSSFSVKSVTRGEKYQWRKNWRKCSLQKHKAVRLHLFLLLNFGFFFRLAHLPKKKTAQLQFFSATLFSVNSCDRATFKHQPSDSTDINGAWEGRGGVGNNGWKKRDKRWRSRPHNEAPITNLGRLIERYTFYLLKQEVILKQRIQGD